MNISAMDEITMRLVHYLVTKENYQPIIVNGLENEIWLENVDKKYSVVRINSNYIHNNEQLDFDIFKAKSVVKQIKKKTFSFGSSTLSILLNVGDNVKISNDYKSMDICTLTEVEDLNNEEGIAAIFPELKNDVIDATNEMDFFINITNDINDKTEEKNRLYEKTFKKKPIVLTNLFVIAYIVLYVLSSLKILNITDFVMIPSLVGKGEIWRLLTSSFFHGHVISLFCNCYCMYVIGTQIETVLGKVKFITVYFLSVICGSLLSSIFMDGIIFGASSAIFGLMGAMVYFGYHYRLYLSSFLTSQLIPIIIANLAICLFLTEGLGSFAELLGGLIGGLFAGMIVGVEGKSDKTDMVNGIICTLTFIGFLVYMVFFR